MEDSYDFEGGIKSLALAKQKLADLQKEYAKPLMTIEVTKKEVKKIDGDIRERALAWFLETGDVQPAEAVSVSIIKRKEYDTPLNVTTALLEAPEVIRIDPDMALVHLPQVIRHILELESIDILDSKIRQEVLGLIDSTMAMMTVDQRQMAQLAKDGATWIEATETATPTVKIQTRLGEYLLED